jgi:hypothetical protein
MWTLPLDDIRQRRISLRKTNLSGLNQELCFCGGTSCRCAKYSCCCWKRFWTLRKIRFLRTQLFEVFLSGHDLTVRGQDRTYSYKVKIFNTCVPSATSNDSRCSGCVPTPLVKNTFLGINFLIIFASLRSTQFKLKPDGNYHF